MSMKAMAGCWRPAKFLENMMHLLVIQCLFLILVVQLYPASSAPEITRPRGVSISKASMYDPEKDFKCFDGSRTLPFSLVNDDYCDCPDASDEPGTSACPSGIFHCTNAGHFPLNIPSSRVNDGICDCCDGTDEYASSAGCENTCLEQGRSARAAALRRAELSKQGNELRLQLIRQGKQQKADKKIRLEQLQRDREEAARIKQEKESLKSTAEELEKAALEKYRQAAEEERAKQSSSAQEEQEAFEQFQRLDSDHDGFIRISDLQTRQTFDKDKNGEVSEEEALYFIEHDELDWSTFYAEAWPKMKPYLMMEKGLFTPPSTPPPSIDAPGENAEEFPADNGEEDEEEEEENPENSEATDVPDVEGEATEVTEEPPQYDENTQNLIEEARKARTEYDEADRSLRDVDREIRDIEDGLGKDFGEEEEFVTLQGQCFEFTDREYTYRMCPFDQVTQTPKNGGAGTRLGSWGRWTGNPKYSTMLFENGQGCWNGPQRTATVNLVCGLENQLTSASEPNRCEYLFEFSTPAVCTAESSDGNPHDEL
ncbi:hypothetical protein FOCC_FOCC011158 [Frankliniella occidentalis]|uniref:Glucosidase 2 subunit beta n=1 Tax=Frankliniella occidentalis TaxID=133901 RepID=A0A6J1TBR9_FRAOC|nr:glucosidase 2 subunit beta [Frankliniella occidentalis]KAE8743223.1 hypothetical protein FOCC_FOCC011158 [Frankliniella occidentalis]